MIRLEQIRVDPKAPDFANPHPKEESICAKQYPDGYEKACLDHYPVHGEEVQAWSEGVSLAQELGRSVGMAPTDADDGEPGDGGDDDDGGCRGVCDDTADDGCGNGDRSFSEKNSWFYRPFQYPGNKFFKGNGSLPTENTDENEACKGGPCISGK